MVVMGIIYALDAAVVELLAVVAGNTAAAMAAEILVEVSAQPALSALFGPAQHVNSRQLA